VELQNAFRLAEREKAGKEEAMVADIDVVGRMNLANANGMDVRYAL